MALNPFGVTGVPGGMGGSTLGLGIVMSLHDMFSKQSTRVERRMLSLDRTTSAVAGRMSRNLMVLNGAIGGLAVSAIGLATMSFPVRSALRFEDAITKLSVVVGDTVSKAQLENMSLDLAAVFPQDPTEMAEAFGTTIKAGIENVDKAKELTRVSNQLAIATGGNLSSVIEGMTSFVNAYQIGLDDAVYSTEDAAKRFEQTASMMFEAMKVGKFSDVLSIEDIEAMMRQFGQIAPIASGLNVPINEFLGLWAASTLGGQNARRSATGLRQAFMDIQNRSRDPDTMSDFLEWMQKNRSEVNLYDGDLSRYVQEHGMYSLIGHVRSYATIEDTGRLDELIQSDGFQDRLDEIMSGLPEDMSYDQALANSDALNQLVDNVREVGGLDVSRINEVFRSIWGVTAILPLAGVQFTRLGEIIERLGDAADSGEVLNAWNEFFDTGLYQFERMVSLFENISILIGSTILNDLTMTMKLVNTILVALQAFIQENQELTGVFFRMMGATFIFTALLSATLALRAGLNLLNLGLQGILAQFMIFPRLARFGLILTFRDIVNVISLSVGAMFALRRAWENNFGGIRDVATGIWERVTALNEAMSLLFERAKENGRSFLYAAEYGELARLGVEDFALTLFAFLWRLRAAWQGFQDGFRGFFSDLYAVFTSLYERALKPVLAYFGIAEDLMNRFIEAGRENVDLWRSIGNAAGYTLGLLLALGGAGRVFSFLAHLTLTLANLRPFVLVLGALTGAFLLLRQIGIDRVVESLAGFLGMNGVQIEDVLATVQRLQNTIPTLGKVYRRSGMSGVFFSLTDALGLSRDGVKDALDRAEAFLGRLAGLFAPATDLLSRVADRVRFVFNIFRNYGTKAGFYAVANSFGIGLEHISGFLDAVHGTGRFLGDAFDRAATGVRGLYDAFQQEGVRGAANRVSGLLGVSPDETDAFIDQLRSSLATLRMWFANTFDNEGWSDLWNRTLDVIQQVGRTLVSTFQTAAYWVEKGFGGDGDGLLGLLKEFVNLSDNLLVTIDEVMQTLRGDQSWDTAFEDIGAQWANNPAERAATLLGLVLYGPAIASALLLGLREVLWFVFSKVAFEWGPRLMGRLLSGLFYYWPRALAQWLFTSETAIRIGMGLVNLFKRAVELARPLWKPVANFFSWYVTTAWEEALKPVGQAAWKNIIQPVLGALRTGWTAVAGWFRQLPGRLMKDLRDMGEALRWIWRDIIRGVWVRRLRDFGRFMNDVRKIIGIAGWGAILAPLGRYLAIAFAGIAGSISAPIAGAVLLAVTAGIWLWQSWDWIAPKIQQLTSNIGDWFTTMGERMNDALVNFLDDTWVLDFVNQLLSLQNFIRGFSNNVLNTDFTILPQIESLNELRDMEDALQEGFWRGIAFGREGPPQADDVRREDAERVAQDQNTWGPLAPGRQGPRTEDMNAVSPADLILSSGQGVDAWMPAIRDNFVSREEQRELIDALNAQITALREQGIEIAVDIDGERLMRILRNRLNRSERTGGPVVSWEGF